MASFSPFIVVLDLFEIAEDKKTLVRDLQRRVFDES
jgi:hypothetical protein